MSHAPVIDRAVLRANQWRKLRAVLLQIAATEGFYTSRLHAHGLAPSEVSSLDDFVARVPFTVKDELLADRLAHPPFGTNFTRPLAEYTRFCQTSGTSTGQPMAWLDTPESWEAMLECWRRVYDAAGVERGTDRIFFAFSFGPFLGFWTAYEAAAKDYLILPSGGISSQARLQMMARYGATVLCCTPTYALRLGELLDQQDGVPRSSLRIRKIIVAGEAGGSIPEVRARLEALWGARVFDHHGMTEVGPVSFEEAHRPGSLTIIEESYFAEVIDPASGREAADGAHGELVLTTLDRAACPLLRYRTGDWVRRRVLDGRLHLEGGVLSRVDDMVVVRGVNVYPTAIDAIARQFPEIVEYLVRQTKAEAMDEIELAVEVDPTADARDLVRRLQARLRDAFSLRIAVTVAPAASLPRHEFKARRWLKA